MPPVYIQRVGNDNADGTGEIKMSNSDAAWKSGYQAAQSGKGMPKTYGKPDAVAKASVSGFLAAKNSGSGKSGK
jgi:hypothetical protein